GGGDPAAGAASNWDHADDLVGDKVVEQGENFYDSDGNNIFTTHRLRFHDQNTQTGELGYPGSSGTPPKARIYYSEKYYDDADRITADVDLGAIGDTLLSSRPD